MQMTEETLLFEERRSTGSSKTNNSEFDENGFIVLRKLCNPTILYSPVPDHGGSVSYYGNINNSEVHDVESQVPGSFARYNFPPYKFVHTLIRKEVEKAIGKKLYNTYFFDRFYYPGQPLEKHIDRDSCEISVTLHIQSNLSEPWPIWIKKPNTWEDSHRTKLKTIGENASVILNPGDAMVYKGCERPHWREPMPTEYEKTWYGRKIERSNLFYHQIFFHYVLADGYRVHFAGDNKVFSSTV